jgi:hypothetical protein
MSKEIDVNFILACAENIDRQCKLLINALLERKLHIVDSAQNAQNYAHTIMKTCEDFKNANE